MNVTVIDRFPQYRAKSLAASQVSMRRMAADIMRLSKVQVPYDTGRLSKSQELRQNGTNSWTISYRTPYARRWHFERARFQHGRKNRYLSDPTITVGRSATTYFQGALKG